MSQRPSQNAPQDAANEDPVELVRNYCASLETRPAAAAAIAEGRAIAAIVAALGLSPELLAAVHLYPLVRDDFIDEKQLENSALSPLSQVISD